MKARSLVAALSSCAIALAVAAGCSSPRRPLAEVPGLDSSGIDEVVVLPVIDARPSPFQEVQVARNVGDATVRCLRDRGYFTLTADRFREKPARGLDLRVAEAAELLPLAPEDARVFLVVQVDRLEPGIDDMGGSYYASLSAALVDRATSRVLWRDVARANSTMSGVLTVFSRGSLQYEAAVNASRLLVSTLPDRNASAAR